MVKYILHGNNCVLKNYLIFVPTLVMECNEELLP